MDTFVVDGQISTEEREILRKIVREIRPDHVVEIGTWMGGGSSVEFLNQLVENGHGHLWGIEANPSILEQMTANIQKLTPEGVKRFTPLLGFSTAMIPQLLSEKGPDFRVQVAFLDGGNNPMEQIDEYRLVQDCIPVGGYLLSHDASSRKGKWFVPYISKLDQWEIERPTRELLVARKINECASPQSAQAAEKELRRLQQDWFEIAARIIPPGTRKLISKCAPKALINRYIHGWKS